MSRDTLLVAEDDLLIQDVLRESFEQEGFRVLQAFDGREALDLARDKAPDLILLDVMLPSMSGFDVCREIRRASTVPILMLTARGEEMDRVLGLELGADDYIVKPFSFREVLARVRAGLRRASYQSRPEASEATRLGSLHIDLARRRVLRDGNEVALSFREFEVLAALVEASGAVVSREALLRQVWGVDWVGDPRTLDVHVRWLREKLETDPAHPRLIVTARGVGYRLRTADEVDG